MAPDGQTLASTSGSDITLCEAETGVLRGTLRGHGDTVECLSWSPDSRMLASASKDQRVILWDMGALTSVAEFRKPRSEINFFRWAPNSQLLLAVYDKNSVGRVWRPKTGEMVGDELDDVRMAERAPDGRILLLRAGAGAKVTLWIPRLGASLRRPKCTCASSRSLPMEA